MAERGLVYSVCHCLCPCLFETTLELEILQAKELLGLVAPKRFRWACPDEEIPIVLFIPCEQLSILSGSLFPTFFLGSCSYLRLSHAAGPLKIRPCHLCLSRGGRGIGLTHRSECSPSALFGPGMLRRRGGILSTVGFRYMCLQVEPSEILLGVSSSLACTTEGH